MPEHNIGQDQQFLAEQYKSADNLALRRRTHEQYGEQQADFITWNLDRLTWTGTEQVLDVGCGDGAYAAAAQERAKSYIAGDLSQGMLDGLPGRVTYRVNLNAQQLPFPDKSMDVILANHMLYHVSDQARAVSEFRRLLRPGGRLLAATNSTMNMPELRTLQMQIMANLGRDRTQINWPRSIPSFTLENGAELLTPYFNHVERHNLPGALIFPEPQPLINYLASMRARYLVSMLPEITWQMVADAMETILSAHIAEHGQYRVSKLAGTFVCW